jgi:hypothetical protein
MDTDLGALGARLRSWYPIAYAMEFRRTWLLSWWVFKSDTDQQRTGPDLMSLLLRDIRLLEQQVQSSEDPEKLRILLIRAQASASQLALDLSWSSEAVRLAEAFRSELEIAVMSPGLSKKDGAVVGDMGPKVMDIYDKVMAGCGQPVDD